MILKVGSRGEDVKKLQAKLGLGADGIFGKGTEDAVKSFQTKNGLSPDGIVGEKNNG
jgi:peptidoglycan hydrolase-like protein with peptidoglycan-binding domain